MSRLLGPDDLGHRATVRYAVGTVDGRPLHTDVVGVLEAITEQHWVLRRRDGSVVEVPRAAVVAARRVPDQPPARR